MIHDDMQSDVTTRIALLSQVVQMTVSRLITSPTRSNGITWALILDDGNAWSSRVCG